jgi:hypothetical protein
MPNRKAKLQTKPTGTIITCPSCGRKGRAAKSNGPVRCSECGKEFKPGANPARRTLIFGVLGLIVIAIAAYLGINRGQRLGAEEKVKEAEEERRRKAAESNK